MSELINRIRGMAIAVHAGQFRRDGKTPYIYHCYEVQKRVCQRVSTDNENHQCVALLHDVLEDTQIKITKEDLLNSGIPPVVVDAVVVLTKTGPNQSYIEYLYDVKQNPLAREVKIADMLSNLADNPTNKQIKKYADGLKYLID
jgi:(p)ppGpp synthase/HD superfamily hydrolase